MTDPRVRFLAKETLEALRHMVQFADAVRRGVPSAWSRQPLVCCSCNTSFQHLNEVAYKPYVFVAIRDWSSMQNNSTRPLTLCCLDCRLHLKLMDLVEIYPTLRLSSLYKLMYNGVIRRCCAFPFNPPSIKRCTRTTVQTSAMATLERVLNAKRDEEEIESVALYSGQCVLSFDTCKDLRIDFGQQNQTFTNFSAPFQLKRAALASNGSLEVVYRVHERFQPFALSLPLNHDVECDRCVSKVYKGKAAIVYCSRCGYTSNTVWFATDDEYDHERLHWVSVGAGTRKSPTVRLLVYKDWVGEFDTTV